MALTWGAVDLDAASLRVVQIGAETARGLEIKPFPKSRAGVREVPVPDFVVGLLRQRREEFPDALPPDRLVFATRNGTALRRSNFRRQVWLPTLVRVGWFGKVVEPGPHRFVATWEDRTGPGWSGPRSSPSNGKPWRTSSPTARGKPPRFHDLRHSCATWLVSEGHPVNVVQRTMGHEHPITTLARYTHAPTDYSERVRGLSGEAADISLTFGDEKDHPEPQETPDDGSESP